MAEKDPLEILLEKISTLISKVQDAQIPMMEIPPELEKELGRLEKEINEQAAVSELIKRTADMAEEDIPKSEEPIVQLIEAHKKKLLSKAHIVEDTAKNLQFKLSIAISKAKEESKTPKPTKQQMKDRRKKFKRLGGDKGWMPL